MTDADDASIPDPPPWLRRKMLQFIALHDAAEVLDELKPPHGDVAAAFLREVGNHVLRDAGLPENFIPGGHPLASPVPGLGTARGGET